MKKEKQIRQAVLNLRRSVSALELAIETAAEICDVNPIVIAQKLMDEIEAERTNYYAHPKINITLI